MIDELEAKGLLEDDAGMKLMRVEGQSVPLLVRKSDGSFGYDSTDLAAIRYRFVEQQFDRAIYVVDAGQALHFDLVFAGAEKAGWMEGGRRVAEHCKFGLVCGDDGKRYRTRDGGVVRLVDLLDEARDRSHASLLARAAKGTKEELLATAEVLAYSGIKYFDLARDRMRDYKFSYDAMLNPLGDTAVYLQYAHARTCSIFSNSKRDIEALAAGEGGARIKLVEEPELHLALQVLMFTDVVEVVRRELQLLPLCKWLRTLCVQLTVFMQECRVLGSEHEVSRLLVLHVTIKSMRQAMCLLGMDVLERL